MFSILPEGILERILAVFVEHLGPLSRIGVTENPPCHILGLYDKYTELRDNDMVDLGSAVPVYKSHQERLQCLF